MYTPRAFTETDLSRLDWLIAADPFVTLVSHNAAGAPFAAHLPVLYRRDGDDILIEGHWARLNPQASHEGTVLLIVHGPHAYVSAAWYPDKEQAARVPTWNYAVAHLYGALERHDDVDALADLIARTSARYEARAGSDWTFDPHEERFRTQLGGVTGFRFVPDRIELKFKLSQNHPAQNRRAVVEALAGRDDADAQSLATLMRANEP